MECKPYGQLEEPIFPIKLIKKESGCSLIYQHEKKDIKNIKTNLKKIINTMQQQATETLDMSQTQFWDLPKLTANMFDNRSQNNHNKICSSS